MKKKITFTVLVIALAMLGMGFKGNNDQPQCGVSNAEIIEYLRNCSHHHSYACCVVDIPGTCNSTATIENCGTATVYVSNGIITGHQDQSGICDP